MLSRDYLSRFEISALVRRKQDAEKLKSMGVIPVLGTLDDRDLIVDQATNADVVFNTASCDHQASAQSIVIGLTSRWKKTGVRPVLIHTSGAGVLSDTSSGRGESPTDDKHADIWDDADAEKHAAIPAHAPHRLVDLKVFEAAKSGSVKTYLVVPPTVFGVGLGPFAEHRASIQIPRLIYQSLIHRTVQYVGTGQNVWANVHVGDLAELYLLILEGALAGTAPEGREGLFYPATEHFTWAAVAHRIAAVFDSTQILPNAEPTTGLRPGWFWGSNVRLQPTNCIALGWEPRLGGAAAMLGGVESDLALVSQLINA